MLNIAIKAAVEAGEAILEIYGQDFEVEFKADASPLTAADKAAHKIIVQALETTPWPVLSEESAEVAYAERKQWNTYWLVDPLDGTKEFIKRSGEFTVNIALVEDGVPTLGIVYVPVADTLYCGSSGADPEMPAWKAVNCKGKSADEIRRSAVEISASRISHSSGQHVLRVVASKSHCNDATRRFIAELEEKFGEVALVSSGSSLKLCGVAEGSADFYPRIAPTMEWDTAAAHAVVRAAGGDVFEYDAGLPVESYSVGPGNGKTGLPGAHAPHPLRYNKENLLNPSFVVGGVRI